jgi:hypothetical protein
MALVTLQMILQDAFPAYEQTHPLPAHVRKAAHALMQCRTAALGGHIQACPDGHVTGVWYNSCRHRSCPQCAFLQTERWLRLQQARLLACDHYHVIFTLPHDLNPLWLANVQVMTTLLFQAVRDTLCTLLADPKYLGAQPGILAALHTWSQTLVLHPHVHCLVTGGGLTPMGQWVAVRNGFLLPARVVMAVFRGKLLATIRQALARAELRLPEGIRPQQLVNLLMRLGHPRKTKWNVHIMERYRHDAADGDRPAAQRLTLSVADFLQRWLLHVPVPQTRVVRGYGLYHPAHASALAVCRTALGQPPGEVPAGLDWQTVCSQAGDTYPERCPTCGQVLVCTGIIPRGGSPPRLASEECAA